ncbi:hypothetical protein ACFL5Q_04065 [Planctomycetota bacterium]
MSKSQKKTVLFRMNGVAAGFLREYGCKSCPQCSASKPQAHISASLIVKDTWDNKRQVIYHALFDCGIGAIDSLIDFGSPPVDDVFISHGHPYHSLGLDRLVWGHARHYQGHLPLPIHCTQATLDEGPKRVYPRFFKKEPAERDERKPPKRGLFHVPVQPGRQEDIPKAGIDLKIRPISVYQGGTAGHAVIWIVEFGSGESHRKLVLGWEFLHFLPPFEGEDPCQHCQAKDEGHEPSDTDFAARFQDFFRDVDELFFDGNTRMPGMDVGQDTKHMSIKTGLEFLIPAVKPKRTWVVHYSGHEDEGGPLSDEELQSWIDRKKKTGKYRVGEDAEINVAKHGMVLVYSV